MVVSENSAADLQRFLHQRLGLSILPLGDELLHLAGHGRGGLKGNAIHWRDWRHPPQCLEPPRLVERFVVLRALGLDP
jgi:hypothetical protein